MRGTPTLPLLILAATLAALLIAAAPASAETIGKTEDATGNGHDFVEENDPANATSSMDKFRDGYLLGHDAPDPHLNVTSSDPVFEENQDFSLHVAGRIPDQGGGQVFESRTDEDNLWTVRVTAGSFAEVRYSVFTGAGEQDFCSFSTDLEFGQDYSLWLTYNQRDLVQNVVDIRMFDENGNLLEDPAACEVENGGGVGGDVFMGTTTSSLVQSDVELFEVRHWPLEQDEDTLDQVADPTDDSFTFALQGEEEAVWFLEPVTLAGDPSDLNTVAMWRIDRGGTVEIFAQGLNRTGDPLAPTNGVNLTVQRVTGSHSEYFDASTNTWTVEAVQNQMNEVSNLLHNLTLPADLDAESTIRLTVQMQLNDPVQGAGDLTYGSLDLEPAELTTEDSTDAASVLSDTSFHNFSGLTSLEWGLFFLTALIGILIWSKSHDHAVRAFGAVLPILGGVLLLGFGTDQGFGSVWMGTLATSVVLTLIGLYMLVRLFLDHLSDAARGSLP